MVMTGEMLKEVLFGGGFLESRLGLWSIKVVVVVLLLSLLTLRYSSVCALTFGRLFWAAILAWKWLAF